MNKNNLCVTSVDIGTSSIRACLFDMRLNVVYQKQEPISLETDISGKAEQDYQEIKSTVFSCISDIFRKTRNSDYSNEAICFSNAVSSLVVLDAEFNPIRPVLTYADVRAYKESSKLNEKYPNEFFNETACPVHSSYWLPKLIWLRNIGFEYCESNYFCTIKDLLVYELTGEFVIDNSNAIATGLCNAKKNEWNKNLLSLASIKTDQLPTILPTTAIAEPIKKEYFDSLNIPKKTKLVLGATDGVLSSLGSGAFKQGQVTTMVGSSGACRIAIDSPLIGKKSSVTWSYPLDDKIWIRGGAMNNGGLVTQWMVNNFYQEEQTTKDDAYKTMLHDAKNILAGSEGLLFLPYIFGERAPIWNEQARGVYFGIHKNHQRCHFARATLEGILFALYSIYEIIASDYEGEIEIRASGGYIQSDLMPQIQSDIFGKQISVLKNYQGSSVGAAILAMKAIGIISSYEEIIEFIKIKKIINPNVEFTTIYEERYVLFKQVYEQLKLVFK